MSKHGSYYMNTSIRSVERAIDSLTGAFIFDATSEGREYWVDVVKRLEAIREDYYKERGK